MDNQLVNDNLGPANLILTCPAGSEVVGGGYYVVPDNTNQGKKVRIMGSFPYSATEWLFAAGLESSGGGNQANRNYTIYMTIKCINIP